MTTSQVETPQVNNELQEMIDREIVAASIDAYRRLGRANSRNAMPVEVVQGEATAKRSGSAFEKFLELAEAKVDFAVIQKKPNPLQGFAKFNPENGTVYELQGVAPNQTEVLKELTGFVVPVVPSLFISQHQIGAGGKILELPPPKLPDSYTDVAASSETLRPAQREAVRKLDAPMSFIWGPPGTGKTYTISQVILEIAKKGEKVIVTSTADKAVKGALGALAKLEEPLSCQFLEDSDPKADRHREYDRYIRLSRKESDRDQASLYKDKALSFLKTANAVFLNSLRLIANKDVLKENGAPTHIIIDEVSMMPVYMVSLIRNAFPRAKLILVGDPNQLSPVVVDSTVAKSPYGCNVYQLAGLNDPRLSEPENIVTFLDQTSRMPARLTQAISNKWYSGALKPTRSPGEFRPLCDGQPEVVFNFEGMPQGNLAFPESKNGAGKNSNATDAQTAVRLAKMAADAGREMMIISPYTGQVNLINHYLKANNLDSRVQATTVHKAQGAEADIVIWSVVANNPHFNKPGNPQADMIATVALSRAKQQVFIVGAEEGTVAYDFIECYEGLGSGAPQAPAPTPEVSAEVNNTPELTPDEEYRNELAASAAEEFFAQDTSMPLEVSEQADEPEPISTHVTRCHYYQDWFDWNNLDQTIWQELQKDGVCTQKANDRWTEPRLTAWFSKDGASYEYSGIQHQSQGWPDWVQHLAQGVKAQYGDRYHEPNSMLVNVYRNGNDYVSMHRDDEPLFDATQPIASVSLGVTRAFSIGSSRGSIDYTVNLEDKSLLLMLPGFQDKYWHGVLRQPDVQGARINLTFRYVKPQEKPEYSGPTTGSDLSFEAAPTATQPQPKIITFSKTTKPYSEFGNMASGYPIRTHGGAVWPTSEHLYQACKFQDEDIRRQILAEKNAYIMKRDIARPNQDKVRADWDQIKDSVMEWCVASKLLQNPSVLETLRNTGNATIVEYSTKDRYWGASKVDGEWQGLNKLGRLLMYLRDNRDDLNRIAIQGLHPAYACKKSSDFTPALAYAGIGARKTPDEVLQYMTQQATFLESMNCLLRTGDAKGADEAFRNGAKYKSVYTPEQPILDWAREKVAEVCDSDYNRYKPITQNLLARNMYQLFGDGNTPDACYPSKFVLYWSEPSSEYNSSQQDNYFNCSSGTRYAVRAAVKAGIPTFNLYNQKELWEQYRDNGFEFPEVVKQVVELTAPDPKPEPERDMTKVLKDRAELLQYIMQRRNSKDKA